MSGTGIVPPDSFTLAVGDKIRISIDPIGSQQSWLHYRNKMCGPQMPIDDRIGQNPQNCLAAIYRQRLKQFFHVAESIGPYVFSRVDRFDVDAVPPDNISGEGPYFSTRHTGYPQIDNVHTEAVEGWNSHVVKLLASSGRDCDGDLNSDYGLGFASEKLISMEVDWYQYCHGTPHGMSATHTDNTILGPPLRELTVHDLFADQAAVAKLKDMFWAALFEGGWAPGDRNAKDVRSEIGAAVTRPDRWLIKPDGLHVSFSSYEGGCYACTPGPVAVKWEKLKPLLAEHAVVP